MFNSAASPAQKPYIYRDITFPGDFMSAGAMVFSRFRGSFMAGDADSHAYALEAGGKTLYIWAKTQTSASQLLMGRGLLSTRLDSTLSSTGWAAGLTYRGLSSYFHFRAGARNETGGAYVAGGQAPTYPSNFIYNYPRYFYMAFVQQGISLTNGSAAPRSVPSLPLARVLPPQFNATYQPRIGPWGISRVMACMSGYPYSYTTDCVTNGESRWLTPDPTIHPAVPTWYLTDQSAVDYNTIDSAGNRQMSPPASPEDVFHIGGKNYGTADTNTAFDGEISSILLYDEEHNATQRQEVYNFYVGTGTNPGYAWNGCDPALTAGAGISGSCAGLPANTPYTCSQTCLATTDPLTSFYPLFGREGIRTCTAGAWSLPSLTCRKRCSGASAQLCLGLP